MPPDVKSGRTQQATVGRRQAVLARAISAGPASRRCEQRNCFRPLRRAGRVAARARRRRSRALRLLLRVARQSRVEREHAGGHRPREDARRIAGHRQCRGRAGAGVASQATITASARSVASATRYDASSNAGLSGMQAAHPLTAEYRDRASPGRPGKRQPRCGRPRPKPAPARPAIVASIGRDSQRPRTRAATCPAPGSRGASGATSASTA